jgi:glycogen operon protein
VKGEDGQQAAAETSGAAVRSTSVDPPQDPSPAGVSTQGAARPEFLGWRREGGGGRFALHAAARTGVSLELYEVGARASFRVLALADDPATPAPFRIWEAEIEALPEVFEYLVRVDGGPPLLDPWARQLSGGEFWGRRDSAISPGVGRRYRGLDAASPFDWQGVARPAIDPGRRVIYELHVRGFTRHSSSGVAHPGTYLGVVEKIPHLVELGVTTVELMPVFEFDETENPRHDPRTGERLLNFWGYSPVSFFAPKAGYASDPAPGAAAGELKTLVRELHRAGLEVVLDVVYNHTAEGGGGAGDPTHSWRGLDPAAYYLHDAGTGRPLDVTGCGNTVGVHHPVARRLILDSLRHWVEEYRVDGFRFDLAAVLFRGERGERLERSPFAEEIAADRALAGRLLIAEPWDATGHTPSSGFPAPWLEWDGEFRDAARRFVGGLEREPSALARRLAGLGPQRGRVPAVRSVRFVACHDGRPLADVVAFARKHNESNGEGNRDGWDGEVAWNGGVEGPTDDPALAARRAREIRLLLALLAAAPGTIQLTAGDELGRTQRGNTNAWCRDDEVGWLDWGPPSAEAGELPQLVRRLLELRRRVAAPSAGRTARVEAFVAAAGERTAPTGTPTGHASTDEFERTSFLLLRGGTPGWLLAANAGESERRFPLPKPPAGSAWRLRLDTARPAGEAVTLDDEAPAVAAETTEIAVAPRSVRLLVAEP